ncbi:sodium:solute symporter [uncultured Brachyspira sp.]|uniref:sodium:solute symporter n=1 Tax=uncultured Brachyspira sp. TaxID=221953 RepID=UPI0025D5952C|nr:sodium:solute symporter [uncultured Brachyspira sp.]
MAWHWFDWVVIFLYFVAMFFIGVWFSKRTKSTQDYFNAGARVPAMVTAMSIYATALSSISFIAVPASVYNNSWLLGMAPTGIILIIIWVAIVFVPFFRRLNVTTAYEYLGSRFSYSIRLLGSLSFIIFHIIRMAIVLYLPTLAMVKALPTVNPVLVTMLVGLFCVAYTSIGGMEAVLWSDAIQTLVLIFGAFLIIIVGFSSVGVSEGFSILAKDNKMMTPDFFSFDFAKQSIWSIIIGSFFGSIYQYIGGQDVVQRYNTTKNEKEAQKSLFLNIPLAITSSIIFIGMGSALWIFFNSGKNTLPSNIDGNAILPYFVMDYLPIGISGLVLAGIFAAAQSTVSSSLNSVSTCLTKDILEKLKPNLTDKFKLNFARASSWIVGFISTYLAVKFLKGGQGDIYLYFQAITGLLGGPIASILIAGIFFDKIETKAVWTGFIVSTIVAFYLTDPAGIVSKLIPAYSKPQVFEMLISFIIIGIGVVVSILASFVFGKPSEDKIKGLTYSTVVKNNK